MHYFYVLRSNTDGAYYYGSTSDLRQRILQHNGGNVLSTKGRRLLTLVYYEAYQSHKLALAREKTVKSSGTARDAIHKRLTVGETGP